VGKVATVEDGIIRHYLWFCILRINEQKGDMNVAILSCHLLTSSSPYSEMKNIIMSFIGEMNVALLNFIYTNLFWRMKRTPQPGKRR
jgi:hypothetical protein